VNWRRWLILAHYALALLLVAVWCCRDAAAQRPPQAPRVPQAPPQTPHVRDVVTCGCLQTGRCVCDASCACRACRSAVPALRPTSCRCAETGVCRCSCCCSCPACPQHTGLAPKAKARRVAPVTLPAFAPLPYPPFYPGPPAPMNFGGFGNFAAAGGCPT
jgi:hypothetical protein